MNFGWNIYWREYEGIDDFSGRTVKVSGWTHDNWCHCEVPDDGFVNPVGIFDSYVSAMADAMGLWDEYCEYHRLRELH